MTQRWIPILVLAQLGNVGLMEAVKNFDPEHDVERGRVHVGGMVGVERAGVGVGFGPSRDSRVAIEGGLDPGAATSNTFAMEWPPHSGVFETFPEIDRVEWFDLDEAARRLKAAQVPVERNLIFHYPFAATPCFWSTVRAMPAIGRRCRSARAAS